MNIDEASVGHCIVAAIHMRLRFLDAADGGADCGRERQFLVFEISRENHRIYYRVNADGVELPSLVCIFASQKSTDSEKGLKAWCKNNAARLESGAILHADLRG
jgi:hypothetical protein